VSSLNIREFQRQQKVWLYENFPNVEPWEALAGMTEEVGELAHAHLKGHNKIRGQDDTEMNRHYKADSLGDLFIYMASYCNTNGLDLEDCIMDAWKEVQQRNWRLNPKDGTT